MAALFIVALGLLLVGWFAGEPAWVAFKRARLRRRPFPAAWREILRARMPYFHTLPADLQLQLKRQMQVFLAEKPIVGCAGLVVTDEMRVLIAAQACLLALNRRDCFDSLREVLLYPGAFAVTRSVPDAAGVLHEARHALAGESSPRGQVVLSWQDVLAGAAHPHDGRNVVIHEFAHQLDQDNGNANGAPRLASDAQAQRWQRVMAEEFTRLQAQADAAWPLADPPLLDVYGALNPAEFFAVASESFFEQPQALAQRHPALYAELASFYRVNPLSWS